MSIKTRVEKVEDAAYKYLDSEVEIICSARDLTRSLIEKWDWTSEQAVREVSALYPGVPAFLLTGKLQGRLQDAENKYRIRMQKFIDSKKPEELARELFDRIVKKGLLSHEEAEYGIRRRFAERLSSDALDSIFTW